MHYLQGKQRNGPSEEHLFEGTTPARPSLVVKSDHVTHGLITFLQPMKSCQESPDLSSAPSQCKSGSERSARQTMIIVDKIYYLHSWNIFVVLDIKLGCY